MRREARVEGVRVGIGRLRTVAPFGIGGSFASFVGCSGTCETVSDGCSVAIFMMIQVCIKFLFINSRFISMNNPEVVGTFEKTVALTIKKQLI